MRGPTADSSLREARALYEDQQVTKRRPGREHAAPAVDASYDLNRLVQGLLSR